MAEQPYLGYVSFLSGEFIWDPDKERQNQLKHGVSFTEAQGVFADPLRVIMEDSRHSTPAEKRYFCFGLSGGRVLTVRFTCRGRFVRIFGAGYWSKGRRIYEEGNQIHAGSAD